jgi:hypothetical protein
MRTYGNVNPLGNWGAVPGDTLLIQVVGTNIAIWKNPGAGRPYRLRYEGRLLGNLSGYRTLSGALKAALGPNPDKEELEIAAAKAVKELIKHIGGRSKNV